MLYPIPLSGVFVLLKSIFGWRRGENNWIIDSYKNSLWFCGSAEILLNICNQVNKKPENISIMLPAYFCGQSLRYLRNTGINFIFYDLCDNLSPDYEKIEKNFKKKAPDIFLHVHYFGNISNQKETRKVCDKYNVIMVEDCAHVIHPSVNSKWLGDYIFFSPHKFFPVAHVSVVFSRQKMVINPLYDEENFPFTWHFKSFLKKNIFFRVSKSRGSWDIKWSFQSEFPAFLTPNPIEIDLLNKNYISVKSVSNKRLANKAKLLNTLMSFSEWRQVVYLDVHNIPYILGMQCKSPIVASGLYTKFNRVKCPVMMWPDLPYEIKDIKGEYQKDINRTRSTIFFFVHEQIDIEKYLSLIRLVIKK